MQLFYLNKFVLKSAAVLFLLLFVFLCFSMKGEAATVSTKISITKDGKGMHWSGNTFYPIDESGVFYYEPQSNVGCPMPDPGEDIESILERNGFHGVVRCKLVDYVDCTSESHNFRESGGSRVFKLGDDAYRISLPTGSLPWYSYELSTHTTPGKPHLIVCQLMNDRERYTTVTLTQGKGVWAAPYQGEEKHVAENQEGDTGRCDIGAAVYTGREFYCDNKPFMFSMLFYPKTDSAVVTISHKADEAMYDELNGAAVARIWMFDIIDPLPQAEKPGPKKFDKKERKVALYFPHPWFLYSQFGLPCQQESQRIKNMEAMVDYLKFCGVNQLQLHIINGSDRATSAWYDSKMYQNLEGNIFKELLPIAEREGIEIIPIVAPIMAPYNKKPDEVSETPDDHGWNKDSCLLDKDGKDYTRVFGAPAPNPLRPEVQQWQMDIFKEVLDRCAKSPAVPAVGFRVNGKIGLCFTYNETEPNKKCGQDSGYDDWTIEQFTKDTGISVPKMEPTSYQYIKDNCWEAWINWRCAKTRDFWIKCRDYIRSYRPDLSFIAACDLPSETPGYNIEWPSGEFTIRDLFRHHGYDPEMFKKDEGIWVQQGMMVASDRYWYHSWYPYEANPWAHKLFSYAPGVAESYSTPGFSGVELYHNYWEESPHPEAQYGAGREKMRTGTPVAYQDFFYEPAVFSLRKVNVNQLAFMGWERAIAGHEHDFRRFSRAFRAIPVGEPKEFDGQIQILSTGPQLPLEKMPAGYKKPEMDVLQASWFGSKLAIVNDAYCSKEVKVSLKAPLKKGQCVFEHGSERIIYKADSDGKAEIKLSMHPFDVQVLSVLDQAAAEKLLPSIKELSPESGIRFDVAAGSETVVAGKDGEFKLKLVNNTKAAMKNVVLNITVPKGWSEKSGDTRIIASLAPGQSHAFLVKFSTSESEGGTTGKIKAAVSYNVAGGLAQANTDVLVYVAFPVEISQATAVFIGCPGETIKASVSLKNMTDSPIKGDLVIDLPSGWNTNNISSIEIQPGEKNSVPIDIIIPATASLRRENRSVNFVSGDIESPSAPLIIDVAAKCLKAVSTPKIDGKLTDWPDNAVSMDTSWFKAKESSDLTMLGSLAPKAWMSWDDQYFYLAVKTYDSDFQNPFPMPDMWKGDSIQIGIDTLRSQPTIGEFFEYGFTIGEKGGVHVRRFKATGTKEAGEIDSKGFAVLVNQSGSVYEAAFKWEELGMKPQPGEVIGLSIVINNYDGKNRHVFTFADGLVDSKNPTKFYAVKLEQ